MNMVISSDERSGGPWWLIPVTRACDVADSR